MAEIGDAVPRFLEITGLVRDGISRGAYPVGSSLPVVAQLAEPYAASETAVAAAIRELRNDGLVVGHTGDTIYVTGPAHEVADLRRELGAALRSIEQRLSALERQLRRE